MFEVICIRPTLSTTYRNRYMVYDVKDDCFLIYTISGWEYINMRYFKPAE